MRTHPRQGSRLFSIVRLTSASWTLMAKTVISSANILQKFLKPNTQISYRILRSRTWLQMIGLGQVCSTCWLVYVITRYVGRYRIQQDFCKNEAMKSLTFSSSSLPAQVRFIYRAKIQSFPQYPQRWVIHSLIPALVRKSRTINISTLGAILRRAFRQHTHLMHAAKPLSCRES